MALLERPFNEFASIMVGTLEDRQSVIFALYIERMFDRTTIRTFSKERTLQWLGWLARNMVHQSQTVFLLEQIHPYICRMGARGGSTL
jgi:hypothetical protein